MSKSEYVCNRPEYIRKAWWDHYSTDETSKKRTYRLSTFDGLIQDCKRFGLNRQETKMLLEKYAQLNKISLTDKKIEKLISNVEIHDVRHYPSDKVSFSGILEDILFLKDMNVEKLEMKIFFDKIFVPEFVCEDLIKIYRNLKIS